MPVNFGIIQSTRIRSGGVPAATASKTAVSPAAPSDAPVVS
jgi:hypothetical protein